MEFIKLNLLHLPQSTHLCISQELFEKYCLPSRGDYSSVEANISAICIGLTPLRCRLNAPPICIRQELSAAEHTSAPVSLIWRILSVSIAMDVSAFLMANVPPKPQHSSAIGNSTRSIPFTFLSSTRGALPMFNTLREWHVGW